MVALDTNTVIYFFKGLGDVAERLRHELPGNVGIPTVVLYELEVGINQSSRPRERLEALHTLLRTVQLLPFDQDAARASAAVRAHLARQGNGIGPIDTLIAGTAIAHSAVLVTRNVREFSRVRGLRTVDWF